MFSQLVKDHPSGQPIIYCSKCILAVYNVVHKTILPSNSSEQNVWPSNNIKPAFWEFDVWTKSKQTKLCWKKKKSKCENWVNFKKATNQANLTSARFRKNMPHLRPIKKRNNNNWDDSQDDFNLQISRRILCIPGFLKTWQLKHVSLSHWLVI